MVKARKVSISIGKQINYTTGEYISSEQNKFVNKKVLNLSAFSADSF